jgi:hypothetical protein
MKNLIKISAAFILILVAFSSCKKDDALPDVQTQLLSKTWTFKSASHPDVAQAFGVQMYNAFLAGQTYTFNADGSYNGLTLGVSVSGTWVLSADNKTLTITTISGTDVYKISITKTSIILEDVDGFILTYE